jgi:hypothetical protein
LHRTEFVTEEFLLVDSGTALFEENRASRLDFDEHGKDWDEPGKQPEDDDQRKHNVKNTLEGFGNRVVQHRLTE